MLLAWLVIWPNEELPNAALAGAANRRVSRFDQRRISGDGDGFLQRADLEHDVEPDELLRADPDPVPLEGTEAGD